MATPDTITTAVVTVDQVSTITEATEGVGVGLMAEVRVVAKCEGVAHEGPSEVVPHTNH